MREQTPSPSGAQDIKDPIEDLPHIHAPGTASWLGWGDQGLQDGPFSIGKITGIRFHRGSFLLTFYLFFIHLLLLYHSSPKEPHPFQMAPQAFSYSL